jgi:transcriptional/translational regulatory protein YebC/TACO1
MAGHGKWANNKHRKADQVAKPEVRYCFIKHSGNLKAANLWPI